MTRKSGALVVAIAAALALTAALPAGAAAKTKTLKVCEHGCKYSSIQAAVNDVKDASSTRIAVQPGTYAGAVVKGHKLDGLTITGTGEEPGDVLIQGAGGQVPGPEKRGGELPQNGIEGLNVNRLELTNMQADNFAANGFFIHADPGKECRGFKMDDLVASWNRAYGMFARNCIGGRITDTIGFGHGDSAIYIGETPPQGKKNRKWTQIARNESYLNVLGYSGTNSKYVDIHDNFFYNNGAGVVPNTLDSEDFEPTAKGIIEDNDIFWNNFDYYMPGSPVETVSDGLGELPPEFGGGTLQYPTGIGVAMFGASGWKVESNRIFGNFKWGMASFSDPFNEGDDAINQNNRALNNVMSSNGSESDANGIDFFSDGSGSGNCYSGNDSTTFDDQPGGEDAAFLYPACPAPDPPDAGTGASFGDFDQLEALIGYTVSDPPCHQEDSWSRHEHPAFMDFEPFEVEGECDPA
jgi:hypothetical protein